MESLMTQTLESTLELGHLICAFHSHVLCCSCKGLGTTIKYPAVHK